MPRTMGKGEQTLQSYLSERSGTIDDRMNDILTAYEGLKVVPYGFDRVKAALQSIRNKGKNFNEIFQQEDMSEDFEEKLDASIKALKKYKDYHDSFWHKLLRLFKLGNETLCGTEVTELLENLQLIKESMVVAKYDREILGQQDAQADKENTKAASTKEMDNAMSMNRPNMQATAAAKDPAANTSVNQNVNSNVQVQQQNPSMKAQQNPAPSTKAPQNLNQNVQAPQNKKAAGYEMAHTDKFKLDAQPKATQKEEQKTAPSAPAEKVKFSKDELRIDQRASIQFAASPATTTKLKIESQSGQIQNTQSTRKKPKIPMFGITLNQSENKIPGDTKENNPPSKTIPKVNVKKYTDEEWENLSINERFQAKKENETREYFEKAYEFFDSDNKWTKQMDSNQKEVLEEAARDPDNSFGDEYVQYLQHRIEGIEKIDQLKATAKETFQKQVPSELNTKGLVDLSTRHMLEDVSQPEMQRVTNGCWSVALASMLGQKGVQIDQETIRTYRPDHSYGGKEDIQNNNIDKGGNSISMFRDLAMDLVPDTALNSAQFEKRVLGKAGTNLTQNQLDEAYAAAKQGLSDVIRMAVLEDKAALGITFNQHYRTIIGVDKKANGEFERIHFFDPLKRGVQSETMDQMMAHFCRKLTDPPKVEYVFSAQWLHSMTNEKGELAPGAELQREMKNKITYQKDGSLKRTLGEKETLLGGENCISYAHSDTLAISSYLPKQLHRYEKTRFKSNLETLKKEEKKKETVKMTESPAPEKKNEAVKSQTDNVANKVERSWNTSKNMRTNKLRRKAKVNKKKKWYGTASKPTNSSGLRK